MSCYGLTNDLMYLAKAEDLAKRLLKAFTDESELPMATVNLLTYVGT